jgi:hypothetical protein
MKWAAGYVVAAVKHLLLQWEYPSGYLASSSQFTHS